MKHKDSLHMETHSDIEIQNLGEESRLKWYQICFLGNKLVKYQKMDDYVEIDPNEIDPPPRGLLLLLLRSITRHTCDAFRCFSIDSHIRYLGLWITRNNDSNKSIREHQFWGVFGPLKEKESKQFYFWKSD